MIYTIALIVTYILFFTKSCIEHQLSSDDQHEPLLETWIIVLILPMMDDLHQSSHL